MRKIPLLSGNSRGALCRGPMSIDGPLPSAWQIPDQADFAPWVGGAGTQKRLSGTVGLDLVGLLEGRPVDPLDQRQRGRGRSPARRALALAAVDAVQRAAELLAQCGAQVLLDDSVEADVKRRA